MIEYALSTAAARGAALRLVHGWDTPIVFGCDPRAVDPDTAPRGDCGKRAPDALRPWRCKFPDVGVKEQCVVGRAADHLVDASKDASLLVVGRRVRRAAIGRHIGRSRMRCCTMLRCLLRWCRTSDRPSEAASQMWTGSARAGCGRFPPGAAAAPGPGLLTVRHRRSRADGGASPRPWPADRAGGAEARKRSGAACRCRPTPQRR
ncbi:universal stress protein [Streptomyces sp. NPDC019208]|uniref:universal stress protein n=1 Tax=Streptomyces sp. NPDC019208 TaxID=3154683 RepID=UPI0033FE9CE6